MIIIRTGFVQGLESPQILFFLRQSPFKCLNFNYVKYYSMYGAFLLKNYYLPQEFAPCRTSWVPLQAQVSLRTSEDIF